MTTPDWADEIARTISWDSARIAAIAAALRKSKADGWRECTAFLVNCMGDKLPVFQQSVSKIMLETADKIERGEP